MPSLRQYLPTHTIIVFSLSLILTLLYFSLEAGLGFEGYGLSDEGFQWYGAIATAKGEVPVRDFHSYDPGRYYWQAAWTLLLGDGIKAHRLSNAMFQALGLFLGLLAIRTMVKPWWGLVLAGIFLIVWMHPRHKLFEHSITMMGIFFSVWLLENPSLKRHFVAGIFVGLVAFIGRNHGLYNALALFLMVLAAWHKVDRTSLIKKVFVWGGGVVAGYSPMLLGFSDDGDHIDLWQFDMKGQEWRMLAPDGPDKGRPEPRYCAAMAYFDGRLLLFGGRSRSNQPKLIFNDLWSFELVSGSWKKINPNREPHDYTGAAAFPGYHAKSGVAVVDSWWYIFGGEGLRGHVSDFWRFDLLRDEWQLIQRQRSDDPVFW